MKKTPTFQTKRKAPKSSGFRMLNASTGNHKKRKQRASTATADDLGEVPGVGVARALIVIALLHVVAIGGIWLHSNWSKENTLKASPSVTTKASDSVKPVLVPGGKYDFVERGDNYLTIARKHGVSVDALKAANSSAPLSPGLKINVPPRRVESTTLSQSIAGVQAPAIEITPPVRPVSRPVIESQPQSRPLTVIESTPPTREPDSEPVLIKPRVIHNTPPVAERAAPRAIEVREDPAPVSYRSHKVVKGNTIWALSQKYGVSSDSLMRLNGITDPSKLRLGMKLKIPTR